MFNKEKENEKELLEESQMTPPTDVGAEAELKAEEREAMDAIRKFTDENDDDFGDISVKSILGGDFLMSKFMMKQIAFVIFCVVLTILYTGNRYDSQQDAILIDSLRGRLQEMKYNVLTQSSELMNLSRQSNVEKALRYTSDSLLHNSITPPFLLEAGEGRRMREEQKVEEVVVQSTSSDSITEENEQNDTASHAPVAEEPKKEKEQP